MPCGIVPFGVIPFCFKVSDYTALIDKVAGVKNKYTVEDVRERVLTVLNSLLIVFSQSFANIHHVRQCFYEITFHHVVHPAY